MTVSHRKSLAFLTTAALLAGCSTAPTFTVPNPMAALNSALTMPQMPGIPSGYVNAPSASIYQPTPANYGTVVPGYTSAAPSYTTSAPSFTTSAPSFTASAPSYTTSAPSFTTSAPSFTASAPSYTTSAPSFTASAPSYTTSAPSFTASAPSYTTSAPSFTTGAPSYSTNVPTLGTVVQASAPSYTMNAPAMQSSTYTLGNTVATAPSTRWVEVSATPVQSYGNSMPMSGPVQPVQASGTTYDLTAPAMSTAFDPAAGLSVDTGYGTVSAPLQQSMQAPSMGGSFQVVPPSTPSLGGGIATYNAAPVTLGMPSIGY